MTQAVVPSLTKMNILGISVGVNALSAAPAVPKGAFLWKYNDQGVMATWHPGQFRSGSRIFDGGGYQFLMATFRQKGINERIGCFREAI